ncbi:MAG: hypothetical protein EBX69_11785 [Betaproteobacteria bacterium]|nr:hypothetical protein [Betaproteobacteria bacterium]
MRRSQDEQQAFEQSLTEIFERHICFNQVLGLTVIALKPEQTEIRFAMRPDLIGHFAYGRLHGGVISATLDATAGCAVMVGLAEKHPDESAQQVIARFASHPMAANVHLDPHSLPAYRALAEHLIREG